MNLLRRTASRIGFDRAIAYGFITQMWSVGAGPVSIFLIARCLTVEEQGYYYTFGSLLAIQVFFELGLTTLLVTFAAHEMAHLVRAATGELTGSPDAKSRLSSLLHQTLRWYSAIAVGFSALAFPLGIYFFNRRANGLPISVWLLPWLGMVTTTALSLAIVPCVSTLEGLGLVKELNLARLRQTIVSNLAFWVILLAGGRLLAAFLSTLLGWCTVAQWVFGHRRTLLDLWREPAGTARISWGREIWPLQWKLALTWISGYFMYQLFTPVLFLYQGPAAAARMGMSLNLTNRIYGLALTWITTKVPTFATLVGSRDYPALDRVFFRAAVSSTGLAALLGGVLWCLTLGLHLFHSPYADRMLDLPSLGWLVLALVVSLVNGAESYYMRAHKEEPLVYLWLVLALVLAGTTYYFGRYYGAVGMMSAYAIVMLVTCAGVSTPVFITRRRHWQRVNAPA